MEYTLCSVVFTHFREGVVGGEIRKSSRRDIFRYYTWKVVILATEPSYSSFPFKSTLIWETLHSIVMYVDPILRNSQCLRKRHDLHPIFGRTDVQGNLFHTAQSTFNPSFILKSYISLIMRSQKTLLRPDSQHGCFLLFCPDIYLDLFILYL